MDKPKEKPMTLEKVMKHAGDMGRYQILTFFLVGIVNMGGNMTMYGVNYLSPKSDHWCSKPPELLAWNDQDWRDRSTPAEQKIHGCSMLEWNWNDSLVPPADANEVPCLYGNSYNESVRKTTAVTKWNLVCDREYIYEFISPIFSVGMLLGAVFGGMISDKFGRKTSLMTFAAIEVAAGIFVYFSLNEWMYIIGRAFTGAFVRGVGPAGAIILVELYPSRWREVALVGYQVWYAIGIMVLTLLAYYIRDFLTLKLILTVPFALTAFYAWILYESPSWLINSGKIDDAVNTVKKIARTNGKQISKEVLENFRATAQKAFDDKTSKKAGSLYHLIKHPVIRKYTFVVAYQWGFVLLTVTSVLFNISALFGDVYMNMLVSALIDLPAAAVLVFGLKYVGRKTSLMFWNFAIAMMGITGIVFTILDKEGYAYVLGGLMLSIRISASLNLGTLNMYTPEVFPTSIRQLALGTTTMVGCITSIFGPYLGGQKVSEFWAPTINVFIAVTALIGCFLMKFMPETMGKKLPFSMEDAINLQNKSTDLPEDTVPTVNGNANIKEEPRTNDAFIEDEEMTEKRTRL